jgi:hypothetical protein
MNHTIKLRLLLLVIVILLFAIVDLDLKAITYKPSRSVEAQRELYRMTGSLIPIDDSTGDDECEPK